VNVCAKFGGDWYSGTGVNLFYIYRRLAEVPGAARVYLPPAKHLLICKQFSKMCPSAFSVLSLPDPECEGVGVKPVPKPSLDRWEYVYKISS